MKPIPGEHSGIGITTHSAVGRKTPLWRRASELRARAWNGIARRYVWLMLDQTVFAATNLILNVLFAHWLTPSDYGRFGLSFSGFILLSLLHWFVVVEPLLVESARVPPEQTRTYVAALVRAHVLILACAAMLCALGFIVARACGVPEIGNGIVAAGFGGCAILALITARRLCLVFLSAAFSALVGIGYLLAATASAWLLHEAGFVNWLVLWAVMASWSLVGATVISLILLHKTRATLPYSLGDLYRATSRYMGWGTCSAGMFWLRTDGMFVILALTQGLPAVAQTRAIVTLTGPLQQMNSALMASWLVDFGRAGTSRHSLSRTVISRAAFYSLAAIVGVILVWQFDGWITHMIYGGKYDAGAHQMPLFLLATALNGVEGMLTSAMKAGATIRNGYVPQMLGSFTVAVVAATMIPQGGPFWAAIAVLTGSALGLTVASCLFVLGTRRNA
jgi:O-antigen/teichoic acid export membrane protein